MKRIKLLAAGILIAAFPLLGTADEKAKRFKWNPENLETIKNGNKEKGAELAEEGGCADCHGDEGISDDGANPNIAGQVPAYFVKQLYDYKNGLRDPGDMEDPVEELDMKAMADLAAYYASLTPAKMAGGSDIPRLANKGDKARLLISCDACHGDKGVGRGFDVPRIAGQKKDYLETTMEAFKESERTNDHYGRMRVILGRLKEDEVEALLEYYAEAEEE